MVLLPTYRICHNDNSNSGLSWSLQAHQGSEDLVANISDTLLDASKLKENTVLWTECMYSNITIIDMLCD